MWSRRDHDLVSAGMSARQRAFRDGSCSGGRVREAVSVIEHSLSHSCHSDEPPWPRFNHRETDTVFKIAAHRKRHHPDFTLNPKVTARRNSSLSVGFKDTPREECEHFNEIYLMTCEQRTSESDLHVPVPEQTEGEPEFQ